MSLLSKMVLQLQLLLLPLPLPKLPNLPITRSCLIVISSGRPLRNALKAKMVADRTSKTRKTRRRRPKIRPKKRRKKERRLLNKNESLARKHLSSARRKRKRS